MTWSLSFIKNVINFCHMRLEFLGTTATSWLYFRNPRPLFSTLTPTRWDLIQNTSPSWCSADVKQHNFLYPHISCKTWGMFVPKGCLNLFRWQFKSILLCFFVLNIATVTTFWALNVRGVSLELFKVSTILHQAP